MADFAEFKDDAVNTAPVRGFLHRGSGPNALVLTHGAGTNCSAPLLVTIAESFSDAGVTVLRCDLPFRQTRPHGPPSRGSAESDQAGLRAAVAALRRETAENIFLGGHSYGGRQASMQAAHQPDLVTALLLLSYPLHPPQKPGQMRTAHFPSLQTPALFVSGERDDFATAAELEAALQLIPARTELMMIPSVGHELAKSSRLSKTASAASRFRNDRADLAMRIVARFLDFTGVQNGGQ